MEKSKRNRRNNRWEKLSHRQPTCISRPSCMESVEKYSQRRVQLLVACVRHVCVCVYVLYVDTARILVPHLALKAVLVKFLKNVMVLSLFLLNFFLFKYLHCSCNYFLEREFNYKSKNYTLPRCSNIFFTKIFYYVKIF